jgi:hypothetical protein
MQVSSVLIGDLPVGPETYGPGYAVTICYSEAEMADLLASYDPASGTSPTVGPSRATLRAILNAVLELQVPPALPAGGDS